MTTTAQPAPTEAIVAFTTGGWALRAPVRAAGRALVAAVLARALGGVNSPAASAARTTAAPGPVRLQARLIGRPERLGVLDAAFLNGIAAAADGELASPVVCAALAAGDAANAPGAVVLDAVVVGTEIALRLATALGASHVGRGWDVAGTCGRLGSAAAAARVFGLGAERMRNALGIAATEAGGLRAASGTMTAAFIHGLAAADGVEAALLGRFGFTGAPHAIEGRRGLAALMSAAFDPGALVAGLGERYAVVERAERANVAEARASLPTVLRAALDRLETLATFAELPLLE